MRFRGDRSRDLLIRAAGVGLLICSWQLFAWLVRHPAISRHNCDALSFAAAAAGFVCFSVGCFLAALGLHVHDRIEISERWRKIPPVDPLASEDNPQRQPTVVQ